MSAELIMASAWPRVVGGDDERDGGGRHGARGGDEKWRGERSRGGAGEARRRHGASAHVATVGEERERADRMVPPAGFCSFCHFHFSIKTSSNVGILLRPLTILKNYETIHRGSP